MKAFHENDRVYDFLSGLNVEFDQVWVQILGKDEVLSHNKTVSIIQAAESRRGVMFEPQNHEASVFVANSMKNRRVSQEQSLITENGRIEASKP